jgi:hypothetical protein
MSPILANWMDESPFKRREPARPLSGLSNSIANSFVANKVIRVTREPLNALDRTGVLDFDGTLLTPIEPAHEDLRQANYVIVFHKEKRAGAISDMWPRAMPESMYALRAAGLGARVISPSASQPAATAAKQWRSLRDEISDAIVLTIPRVSDVVFDSEIDPEDGAAIRTVTITTTAPTAVVMDAEDRLYDEMRRRGRWSEWSRFAVAYRFE